MDFLNVACPHCKSAVRVGLESIGKQVACPICRGGFAIPELPSQGALVKFGCPFCSEPFQVPEFSLGSAVQCPNCHSAVALPEQNPEDDSSPPEPTAALEVPGISREDQSVVESSESVLPNVLPSKDKDPSRFDRRTSQEKVTPKSAALSEAEKVQELGNRIDEMLPPRFAMDLPAVVASTFTDVVGLAVAKPSVRSSKFVTVRIHGEDVQLRRLTPEEVASRKATRNLFMFVLGAVLLAILGILLRQ